MDYENQATSIKRDLDNVAEAVNGLTRALAVMVCDHRIRTFLLRNDPKALQQAEKALDAAGFSYPDSYAVDDEAILQMGGRSTSASSSRASEVCRRENDNEPSARGKAGV